METLIKAIAENCAKFNEDAAKAATNKAAGARARKVSLELEKQLKAFRKESIACQK